MIAWVFASLVLITQFLTERGIVEETSSLGNKMSCSSLALSKTCTPVCVVRYLPTPLLLLGGCTLSCFRGISNPKANTRRLFARRRQAVKASDS